MVVYWRAASPRHRKPQRPVCVKISSMLCLIRVVSSIKGIAEDFIYLLGVFSVSRPVGMLPRGSCTHDGVEGVVKARAGVTCLMS